MEGTLGQYSGQGPSRIHLVESVADARRVEVADPQRLAYVTQTTLSMDDTAEIVAALRERFPAIAGPRKDDICYATQNRQDAVKRLARHCQLVLVVGSANSSNSNRLREIAERMGVPAYLIDDADEIQSQWLEGVESVGVTAGASVPEVLVEAVVGRLKKWGAGPVENLDGREENVVFSLPRALQGGG